MRRQAKICDLDRQLVPSTYSHRREGLIISHHKHHYKKSKWKSFVVTHELSGCGVDIAFNTLKDAKRFQAKLLGLAKTAGFSWYLPADELQEILKDFWESEGAA